MIPQLSPSRVRELLKDSYTGRALSESQVKFLVEHKPHGIRQVKVARRIPNCACGQPSVKWFGGDGICQRCLRIEKLMARHMQ